MSAAEIEVFVSDQADSVRSPTSGVVVGTLAGFNGEHSPLVVYKGHSQSALLARSIVDLHGGHIGSQVVLQFDEGNPERPIVMGVLRTREGWPLEEKPAQVEADVDGARMVITAKEQLVLRCGKASITLTKAGKVLIHGTYVSNQSSGVMRLKGGSVQLN
jgi:hypothetical protein